MIKSTRQGRFICLSEDKKYIGAEPMGKSVALVFGEDLNTSAILVEGNDLNTLREFAERLLDVTKLASEAR